MSEITSHEQATSPRTALRGNSIGVAGILFFVFSAQAPLTGVVGAAGLAIALGNGAGAPGAYLAVGLVIILFAVGFTTITRHIDARGGFFAILRAGLGSRIGAAGSLLALLSYNTIQAAMYGLLGATTSSLLLNSFGLTVPWWGVVLLSVVIVGLLGSRGIEVGARVLAILVVAEVLLLLAFAVVMLMTRPLASFDLWSSFGPTAILAGSPGIAIMFAIASMFGFESTAIYSGEAKNPRRTVPTATYIAVIAIAVFFAFVMWMLVSYYGAANAQDAALATLSTDPALFVLAPLEAVLGPGAGSVAEILLCTSLLAGLLAFHNMVTRYFHAMSGEGVLPRSLARTNRHNAPAYASIVQSVVALVLVAPFALAGLDPVTTLFAWFSGVAVASLVLLYSLTSAAVIAYFHRHRVHSNRWSTLIAPAATVVLMLGELLLIIANFPVLTGSSPALGWALLAAVPVAFAIGWMLPHSRTAVERTEGATR